MSVQVLQGDCREVLKTLEAQSVNCCVTSPPYFGLRDYFGGSAEIGKEATPQEYVEKLVEVFREVRRVLRDDGTCFINIGDSYAANRGYQVPDGKVGDVGNNKGSKVPDGLKPKDLIGIPWMLAFALRADGWYLRQDIIWAKPNPMPESVTDRCTKSHEYIFLLSKSARYYYDYEAIKEPSVADHAPGNNSHKGATAYETEDGEHHRTKVGLVAYAQRQRGKRDSFKREDSKRAQVIPGQSVGTHRPDRDESEYEIGTRNKRSVWTVSTKPFSGAHFATFPPDLIEPCIKAGCPEGGVVLDPFGGAGTTGLVCDRLHRDAILIELNPTYADLARKRITNDAPLFAEVA